MISLSATGAVPTVARSGGRSPHLSSWLRGSRQGATDDQKSEGPLAHEPAASVEPDAPRLDRLLPARGLEGDLQQTARLRISARSTAPFTAPLPELRHEEPTHRRATRAVPAPGGLLRTDQPAILSRLRAHPTTPSAKSAIASLQGHRLLPDAGIAVQAPAGHHQARRTPPDGRVRTGRCSLAHPHPDARASSSWRGTTAACGLRPGGHDGRRQGDCRRCRASLTPRTARWVVTSAVRGPGSSGGPRRLSDA